ncbi:MAG: isochorismatase family protein [Sphingobacteriales bacterium]|nr:MAG: isochorismatase family protein [Sphingobacteriales bacterium]
MSFATTGISADICILFSAKDAYMRDLGLSIPADCIASDTLEHTKMALTYMERVLGADTTPSEKLDLPVLCRQSVRSDEIVSV